MNFLDPRSIDLNQPMLVPRPNGGQWMGLVRTLHCDEADIKASGAVWSRDGWSVDLVQIDSLVSVQPWLPRVACPVLNPLVVDLIPSTSWFSSLANLLAKGAWDKIRKRVLDRDVSCLECGLRLSLEVHEIWQYNESTGIQHLVDFELLCHWCHETRHLGLAMFRRRLDVVFSRLALINRLFDHEHDPYYKEVLNRFNRRSSRQWTLDLSLISGQDLKLAPSISFNGANRLVGKKTSTWVIGVKIVPEGGGFKLL